MDKLVCAFLLEGTPIIYVGVLVEEVGSKLLLSHAVLQAVDTKNKNECAWYKVPMSGKHSLVQIDTSLMRGLLVKDIDHDAYEEYKRVSTKLYSKLHTI